MNAISRGVAILILSVCAGRVARALPLLESPVPLPASFDGVITIYPDSQNTTQIRRYWLVPSTVRIHRDPSTHDLAFGLVHSGVSRFDPDGVTALLNVTIEAYVDKATLDKAKALIQKQATAEGATSVTFSFIAPIETAARILVGGQYAEWGGQNALVIKGGIVEAGIPFQVKVTKSEDARAMIQTGGPKAALFGAEFRMKFNGQGTPCHIHLHAKFEETYKHMLASVKASGWFGLVSSNMKYETQELRKTPGLTLEVTGCTEEQMEKYHAVQMFDSLFNAINNRTGLFAKQLQASGLPDAPGGGGIWGWSLSVGGGFESYTDTTDFDIDEQISATRVQEIAYGLNFPAGGSEMTDYVKNLSDSGKPFPTSDDYLAQKKEHEKCAAANKVALISYRDDHTITQAQYDSLILTIFPGKDHAGGCYVDYVTAGQKMLKFKAAALKAEDKSGSKLTAADYLQFFAK